MTLYNIRNRKWYFDHGYASKSQIFTTTERITCQLFIPYKAQFIVRDLITFLPCERRGNHLSTVASCHQNSYNKAVRWSFWKIRQNQLSWHVRVLYRCSRYLTTPWENLFMSYANNKETDQPAHRRSLINAFLVRCLDRIIHVPKVAIYRNS